MLDDAITYADDQTARQLAQEGLEAAQGLESLGEIMYFKAQREIIEENYESAISFLNLAIRHNPSDGAAYNDRALCVIELNGKEENALSDFDQGIEAEPDYASVYHNKGWYLNKLKRHQEAIPYLEKALTLEPGRAVTYENLADTYFNLGETKKALEAYRRAFQCLNSAHRNIKDQIEERIKVLIDRGY